MVNRCSLCKDSKELADRVLIHCVKTRAMDLFVSRLWLGLGVSNLSEKSPPRMEI